MEIPIIFMLVITLSVVVMAAVQVAAVVYGVRLVKRVNRMVDQIEKEIKPALDRVNDATGDVTRATSLAVAQLERVDQLFGQLTERVEHLMTVGQDAVVEPLRKGVAVLAGLKAAVTALRDVSNRMSTQTEDSVGEDQEALFIG